MSSILQRIGTFFSSFKEKYDDFKRPRIPVNLLKSKEPDIKRDVILPEVNTPRVEPKDENVIGEFFRP